MFKALIWTVLEKEEIHNLYCSFSVSGVFRRRTFWWAGPRD